MLDGFLYWLVTAEWWRLLLSCVMAMALGKLWCLIVDWVFKPETRPEINLPKPESVQLKFVGLDETHRQIWPQVATDETRVDQVKPA